MRRMLLALVALAVLGVARPAGTSAQTAPLPACVDQQYSVDAAGTTCQIRGDTTPTALCMDGTFDYSRRFDACLGHGGVYLRLPPAGTPDAADPDAGPGPITAICNDGWQSHSQHVEGTCSHHQGVQTWINKPATGTEIADSAQCRADQIKGEMRSMIYHVPGSRDYARTMANVVCFDTEQQAQAAGYRKADV